MIMPPVYKFLDVKGAKLTLGNKMFKHAKPSDFNDVEDLSIQSIFSEETEAALIKLSNGFTDIILDHLNDVPTCNSPIKEKVALLQHLFRSKPEAAILIKAEIAREGIQKIYDVEHMREQAEATMREINDFMQDYRILCVTTIKDSENMWSDYAEQHKGIAVRIEPNLAKDSKFRLFRPVIYREKRPPLYDDTLEYMAGSLFGDQKARLQATLDKIVYAKTLEWQHECEYRLAIPLRQGEEPWSTLPYHPEEITELYLGLEMNEVDSDEIVGMARTVNPDIMVFVAKRDANKTIKFDRV